MTPGVRMLARLGSPYRCRRPGRGTCPYLSTCIYSLDIIAAAAYNTLQLQQTGVTGRGIRAAWEMAAAPREQSGTGHMGAMQVTDRADVLLLLLFAPGPSGEWGEPVQGRTRLVKLLFLLNESWKRSRESGPLVPSFYEFYPYRFGPFSKEIFDDVEFFRNLQIVDVRPDDSEVADVAEVAETIESNSESLFADDPEATTVESYNEVKLSLTERGRRIAKQLWEALPENDRTPFITVKERYGAMPLTRLLRHVYSEFPESARESERKDLV